MGQFDNIYWGNIDIYWLSFYIFPEKYLGISYSDFQILSLNMFYQLCEKIGWIWYFKNVCFISDRPQEINKKGIQLHAEGKPAIKFRDGYSSWCLNGVNVPKELAETPTEQLNPEQWLAETNVEIRAQFICKFGVDRLKKYGKSIEKNDVYELMDMNNLFKKRNNQYTPFLFMRNPSTGTIHCEGIIKECKTIEQAINWRNQIEGTPNILT